MKRLHSQFSFDQPGELLAKMESDQITPSKRQKIVNVDSLRQVDPVENLLRRIMYAEGDIDLSIEAEPSPTLLHLKECLPSIVAKLA